jgi:uncharacterized protein (UPF0276 family)
VGLPLGSSLAPSPPELDAFARLAADVNALWVSEHLSFNRFPEDGGPVEAGFLLPPNQTEDSVRVAAHRIRAMQAVLSAPLAFETGVNYLRPRTGELSDGDFFRWVAEEADCGILLDLHNVWCNAKNGRQSLSEFLSRLPLDRIWELHLAGGDSFRGYRVDAHSDLVPGEVMDLARELVPTLPNLRAVVFEIIPDYIPHKNIPLGALVDQLGEIRELWRCRPPRRPDRIPAPAPLATTDPPVAASASWESTLGEAVISPAGPDFGGVDPTEDPGIDVYRELIGRVRLGMLADTLRYAVRLLTLTLGEDEVVRLARDFWREVPPAATPIEESRRFAAFLAADPPAVPHLAGVLAAELAAQDVVQGSPPRSIPFRTDPVELFRRLGRGEPPSSEMMGAYELTVAFEPPDPA